MKEVNFNGEHLLPGNIGHIMVVLSFSLAILSAFSYFMSTQKGESDTFWKSFGRITFGAHFAAVLGVIISLFYIIHSHYYEYSYAWQHSSDALPVHYMISCFWEGQEGSFLLWLFWHAVIGGLLIFRIKKWETPVMTIVMLAQVVLASMILGVENFAGFTIGSSPFELLRVQNPELLTDGTLAMLGASPADYLSAHPRLQDGTGLNPLLQNYWMVIHPPTLFFGFAASIVPFAFAVSGLWLRKYRAWIKEALPWTLVSVMILGTGIIMGGIWAYESLSFGGYWAWDPVENASLIPWILIIAGLHVMILNKNSGNSLSLAYLLVMSSFILVLYSTFLNRSGILGDTSVHSFTDLGLSGQLLILLCMFSVVPVVVSFKKTIHRLFALLVVIAVLGVNIGVGQFLTGLNLLTLIVGLVVMVINFSNNFPVNEGEEKVYSREFWMYVGSIVLLLSSLQILGGTSLPVLNKIGIALLGDFVEPGDGILGRLAAGSFAPPEDPEAFYNRFQIWFAIVIAILTGFGQFFRYKTSSVVKVVRQIRQSFIVSAVLTVIGVFVFGLFEPGDVKLIVLLFAASYAIAGNAMYILEGLKGKLRLAGGSLAHIGFGLMLVGILVSSGKKQVISLNDFGIQGFEGREQRENIVLYKGLSDTMQDYLVTYKGHSFESPNHYYEVEYKELSSGNTFTLYPNAQINQEQGLLPNPDTRHYLTRDVFTHVSSVPSTDEEEQWEDPVEHDIQIGDSIPVNNHLVIFDGIDTVYDDQLPESLKGYTIYRAMVRVTNLDSTWVTGPVFARNKLMQGQPFPTEVEQARIRFEYVPTGPTGHRLVTSSKPREYIIMKAIVFPYINLLWAGTLVMVIGFVLAIRQRLREKKVSVAKD